MSTMISEVYDAFIEAGASQERARKAVEAVANYETRFNIVEQKLTVLQADMTVVKWIGGLIVGGVIATLVKLYVP